MTRSYLHPSLRLSAVSVSLLSLALASGAVAEDSRGRLPDGRAFRTDKQGNEIVDYIAELELDNEALNRRIKGLETEVEEKNRQLAKGGGATASDVTEKDLIHPNQKSREAEPSRQEQAQQAQCTASLASLQSQVRTLSENLEEERRQHTEALNEYAKSLEHNKAEAQSAKLSQAECIPQVAQARADLDRLKKELSAARENQDDQTSKLQKQLDASNEQLETARKNLQSARAELDETKREMAEARESSESERLALEKQLKERQNVASAQPPNQRVASASIEAAQPANGTLAQARDRAVESLRGGMRSDYTQLTRMIRDRDALFAQLGGSGPLKVRPSKLVSSRGLTPDQIEDKIGASRSVYELTALKRDIAEIRSKVSEDMTFAKRMQRSGGR